MMSYGGGADVSFGSEGILPLPPIGIGTFDVRASVVQPDGKIVAVGNYDDTRTHLEALAVTRFNVDGSVDTTFGISGLFVTPALSVTYDTVPISAVAINVALQPNGDIVAAGVVGAAPVMVRLDATGMLDPAFGTGGFINLPTNPTPTYFAGLAIQANGKIALAVSIPGLGTVERFNPDGSLDTSFGTGGMASTPGAEFPRAIIADPDGDLIISSSADIVEDPTIRLTALNSAGQLDPAFGTSSQVTLTPNSLSPLGEFASSFTLAAQPDGKIVLGGSINLATMIASPNRLFVARLTATGSLDPTFGNGGINIIRALVPARSGEADLDGAILLQPDGKILLADGSQSVFVRLDPNGFGDSSFGAGGVASFVLPGGSTYLGTIGLGLQPGGKILATIGGAGAGMYRLLGQGAPGDYNDDGISDPAIFNTSTASFTYASSGNGSPPNLQIGIPGAGQTLPAPGAYNGDGVSELAVYLPTLGAYAVRPYYGGHDVITPFGSAGNSLPAPGDYDGSGKTEYGVYLPSLGAYAYRPAGGGPDVAIPFGIPGKGQDIPAPADYYGTGQDDIAVYLVSQGAFEIRNPLNGAISIIPFGLPGAGRTIPVPGDYDGSGKAELAVYLPAFGAFVYRPANGGADGVVPFGGVGAGVLPAPGDYTGSGKTDVAAYFPSAFLYAYRPVGGGADVYDYIGTPNQTIPFVLASATDSPGTTPSGGGNGNSFHALSLPASTEIPLTQDILDLLAGPSAKKAVKPA